MIASIHDTNPALVHINSLRKATQVWPISHAVASMLSSTFHVPQQQMRMLSNRVNLNVFRPQSDSTTTREQAAKRSARVNELAMLYPGRYRILFVGRRQEQKNWDTVMRALSVLGDDYVGIFVGRGPRAKLIEYATERNLMKQVYLVDAVASEDLRHYMWLSDCFCVPSRWEGFGIVFIEAMAAGSVVITSNIAPMSEFIVHERSGLLVDQYEDETKLAEMIMRGIHEEKLREVVRANGMLAAARFSKEEIDRWEVSLYRGVLGLQQ